MRPFALFARHGLSRRQAEITKAELEMRINHGLFCLDSVTGATCREMK